MAFEVGSVVARIKADITDFEKGIDNAKDQANGFGDHLQKIGAGIADFGKQAAIFTSVVGVGFAFFAKSSIDAYNESEKVTAQLDAVLKSTKDLTPATQAHAVVTTLTAKETAKYSDELEKAESKLDNLNHTHVKGEDATYKHNKAIADTNETIKELQAKLASTTTTMEGGYIPKTQMSRDALINLSKALQLTTTYSDETVLSAENLLLTFTNIGKDIFPQATSTVLDMATALGEDTKSASIQLGKALQDPILGITALRRVGVNFNDAQKDVIKNLVETGKTAEAQKLILKELATEFGGSAAAAGQTFAGKLEIMKNQFNDLQETIGKGLVDALYPLVSLLYSISQNQNVINFVNNMVAAFTAFFTAIGTGKFDSLKKALDAMGASNLVGPLTMFVNILRSIGEWVMTHQSLVLTFLQGLGIALAALLVVGTITILITALLNPLTLVVIAITALFTAWQTNFMGIQDITKMVVTEVMNFFNNYLEPLFAKFQAKWAVQWPFISAILKAAWDLMVGIIKLAWDTIYNLLKIGIDLWTGNWTQAWKDIVTILKIGWGDIEGVLKAGLHMLEAVGGFILDAITKPFRDAWAQISDLMNKIKDALDFTKRHSPSVVDIVQNGVAKVNDALSGINMDIGIPGQQMAANLPTGGGGSFSSGNIYIDMAGAIIADSSSAATMGEKIGDAIIDKLRMNIRI